MSALEARYRAALRWYPRRWRAANADAVIGTLLDAAAAEGRAEPARGELTDLAVNGIRARVDAAVPVATRDRAASLALGTGFGLSVVLLYGSELMDRWVGQNPVVSALRDAGIGFGPFASVGGVVLVLWMAAFVLGMLGLRIAMTATLGASTVTSIIVIAGGTAPWAVMRTTSTAFATLAFLAFVSCMGAPGRTRRCVGWTAIAAATSLAGFGAAYLQIGLAWNLPRQAWRELSPSLVFAVFGLLLVIAVVARRRAWIAAVLLVSAPWLILALLQASHDSDAVAIALCSLVVCIAVVAAIALGQHPRAAHPASADSGPIA